MHPANHFSHRRVYAIPTNDELCPCLLTLIDEHALASAAVEFAIEDFVPGPKIEASLGDGDDDLPAHGRFKWASALLSPCDCGGKSSVGLKGQLFEPLAEIVMQPDSLSLMNTEAVMCMVLTSTKPSLTPLFLTASATCDVMRWRRPSCRARSSSDIRYEIYFGVSGR